MKDYPFALLRRAADILRTEGLWFLVTRSIHYIWRYFFSYSNYYLHEQSIRQREEIKYLPKIDSYTFRIVRSNEEADRLAADIGYDFRRLFIRARNSLKKGAIAFCVFVDSEVAHIGWAAMNAEAKRTFDSAPYYVGFSDGEACAGGAFTIPKYRSMGLMSYVCYKRFEYLRDRGITLSRNAVSVDNTASQKVLAKFNPIIYAKARYIRILWYKYWKEIPFRKATN
jgi:GNAT superfamily N-acetyltransferase